MTLSKIDSDLTEMRRERVATLHSRGLSEREIALTLATGDRDGRDRVLNPDTGKPFSIVTIHNDLVALRERWRENANASIEDHIARQLEELKQVKRWGWAKGNAGVVMRAIEAEIKLLGTAVEKDGLTVNIQIVAQLVAAIESVGGNAAEWFVDMANEMQLAKPKR